MGTQLLLPIPKRGEPPIFGPCLLWPNGWMDQDETWQGGRPRPWPHCVRWGSSSPSPKGAQPPFFDPCLLWPNGTQLPSLKKGQSPPVLVHVCCGQTAEWIKVTLGLEVGLGPGDIVFDRDPTPPEKRHSPHPIFGPCILWPNGWMDDDATWYGSRPRPRPHCVRRGLSSPCERGTTPPSFRPMSIVATVAHLSYC